MSVSNKERNHFLSSLTRTEHQRPYYWGWLEDGDTVLLLNYVGVGENKEGG